VIFACYQARANGAAGCYPTRGSYIWYKQWCFDPRIAAVKAFKFHAAPSPSQIEASVKCLLDGFVDAGGYWSTGAEAALRKWCRCIRIPKLLVPRRQPKHFGKYWAYRLIAKLGLN
jgi:hypothetical protein